jgi:flagellar biosynthesis protein FliQ
MSNDVALYLSKQLLWHALIITAPVVLVVLFCGFFISILQAVTQIQDSTLSFVPKILAAILVLMFCSGWMLHTLIEFAQTVLLGIPGIIKS